MEHFIKDICKLVEIFYPNDLNEEEKACLRIEVEHYQLSEPHLLGFIELSSISNLSQWLVKIRKSNFFTCL